MKTFYAAMLLYPDSQKKAQSELDRILGGRLPEFTDENDLPYIAALIKETLRYVPIHCISIYHITWPTGGILLYHLVRA